MKVNSILPLGICTAVILFFLSLVLINSVDIPNGDDLFCLMLFTQQFQDASTLVERLQLLVSQWVEHRIVYSRFTALLSYWLTGQVNFVVIILIGNLTLIGFTLLFWKIIKKGGSSLYYLIPIVLTLFSPVTYEANLWAGASTVYMPVAFLGLLTIYLLVYQNQAGLVLALLTSILATYSFGNGMFSFLTAVCVLLYQKRFKAAAIFAFTGFAAIFLYFQNFEAHSGTGAFSLSAHFREPMYLLYNLFGFVGGILDYTENISSPILASNIPAVLLGLLLFASLCGGIFIFLMEKRNAETGSRKNLKVAWLGMSAFICITAVVMAYSRTSGAAMNTLSSRYKIYSMLCWILVYSFCLIYFKRKKLIGIAFGGLSLVLLLFNYYTHYDKFTNYKSYFLSGLFNYNKNGHWVIYRHTSYYEGASKILCDSIAGNPKPVYTFKQVYPELTRTALENAPVLENIRISPGLGPSCKSGSCIDIHSDDYPSATNFFKGLYLVVYDHENMYLFVADPARNGRLNMFLSGNYYKKGFFLFKDFGKTLKPGSQYNLAVFCPTELEKIMRLNYRIDG